MKQSLHDVITGELSLEYFARRFSEGWKIASIEWFREISDPNVAADSESILNGHPELPYGLEITEAGLIQENPLEATVLLMILEQIIQEKRITEIASELNRHGYATRDGQAWSPADVFNLLPRLIEAGPSLLKSTAWQQRRPGVQVNVPRAN